MDEGRELDWNEPIQNNYQEFIVLPDGDYPFRVITLEKFRHPGSDNLPPCPKAVIGIEVSGAEGKTLIKHNLFLHEKTQGMLIAFFNAIGQHTEKGETLQMRWDQVIGATGRCQITSRQWTNDKGNNIILNQVKKFYGRPEPPQKFNPGKFIR